MKTLLNLGMIGAIAGFFFVSCNDNDDYETIQSVDRVKIDSVKIVNDTMDLYSVQSIRTYSQYNANCEGFYGYDYVHTADFERTVTSYKFKTNANCGSGTFSGGNQINFAPKAVGTYTFKFWNGGNNYITQTIVVQ